MLHDLADRVRAGDKLVGTWLFLNDVGAAEIFAGAGFDFVVIDMEHGATGFDNLRNMIMAIERHTAPMVRVKGNSPSFITSMLDLGAAGVIVPMVNTADEARMAVASAKCHPLGQRGCGPVRVSDYGRNMNRHLEQANDKQMLWVQIEQREAVDNIDQIVRVPGVDMFVLGRGNLSQSLGRLMQPGHPEVAAAAMQALVTIERVSVPAAAFGEIEEMKPWRDAGVQVVTIQSDQRFLADQAAQALADTRALLAETDPSKG